MSAPKTAVEADQRTLDHGEHGHGRTAGLSAEKPAAWRPVTTFHRFGTAALAVLLLVPQFGHAAVPPKCLEFLRSPSALKILEVNALLIGAKGSEATAISRVPGIPNVDWIGAMEISRWLNALFVETTVLRDLIDLLVASSEKTPVKTLIKKLESWLRTHANSIRFALESTKDVEQAATLAVLRDAALNANDLVTTHRRDFELCLPQQASSPETPKP